MQTKRILSLVMALAMLFTLTMPALAWAAEGDEDGNPGDVSSQGDVGTDTVDIGAVGNGENDPADNGSASGAAGNTENDPADNGSANTGAAGNTEGDPVEGGNPDPGSAAGGDPAAEPTEEPASEEGDGVPPSDPIAAVVGGEAYASFTEALAAALASGAVLELRANAPKEVVLSDGETLLVLAGEFSITVRAAEGCSLSVSDPDAGGVVTYRAAAEAAAPSELPEADPSDDPQPLDDPTPEVSVARVGDEMYATLWEAIDAAPSGAIITLLEAVSETFYVSSNVVLDLNGNSIEANSTVFNYGTLKIIGSGTITGSLSNEGTLTVAGGTMTSVAERTILNKGTLLVSGGTVENRANGVYCAIDNDGGTIRVTGGTVKGCTAIRLSKATEQDGAVDLTVSDGKIQGTDLDIDWADDSAVLSITGGTFAHDPTALLDPAAFCAFPEGDGYAVHEAVLEPVCTHENQQRAFDEPIVYAEIPGDNKLHMEQYPYRCLDCNQIVYESLPLNHEYVQRGSEIVCVNCGHVNTCPHDSIPSADEGGWSDQAEKSYAKIDGDDIYHNTTGTWVRRFTCPDCGSWEEYAPDTTHQEGHIYSDGVCELCNHTHSLKPETLSLDHDEEIEIEVGRSARVTVILAPDDQAHWDAVHLDMYTEDDTNPSDILQYEKGSDRCYTLSAISEGGVYVRLEAPGEYRSAPCHVTVVPKQDAFQCGDNLTWAFDQGTLTIDGYGDMDAYSESAPAPWTDYAEQITTVSLPAGITSIGAYAFYGCSGLTEIVIPTSVSSIGTAAFSGCSALAAIAVDGENETYASDGGVLFTKDRSTLLLYPAGRTGASYSVPTTVTKIAPRAFQHCTYLVTVSLPAGLQTVGDYAFYGCSSLATLSIPTSLTTIGKWAYAYCGFTEIVIPHGLQLMDTGAFEGCESLTKVTIRGDIWGDPDRQLPNSPFMGCANLRTIILEEGVTRIAEEMFSEIPDLQSISLPSTLSSIGECAFYSCNGLTSIVIPGNVRDIGHGVFEFCKDLASVRILEGVETIPSDTFLFCTSLTSVELPSTLSTIGASCFEGCSTLTSISIPEGVTTIESRVFSGCANMSDIDLPVSLQRVEESAFEGCSGLERINYAGTKADRRGIAIIDASYSNSALRNAAWQFSYEGYTNVGGVTEDENTITIMVALIGGRATLPVEAFVSDTDEEKKVTIEATVAQVSFDAGAAEAIVSNSGQETDLAFNLTVTEDTAANTKTLDITLEAGGENVFADGTSGTATITIPYAGADENTVVYLVTDDGNGGQVRTPVEIVSFKEGESVTFTVSHFSTYEISQGQASALITGTCGDDLNWSFEDGVLSINGTGAMYDFENAAAQPWADYSAQITSVSMMEGLTTIGAHAFRQCLELASIDIPDSVTHIGAYAFADNELLTSVSMGSGVTSIGQCAFDGCTGIASIALPDGLISIGAGAFELTGLTSITIPDNVESIEDWAFNSCTSLQSVTIGNGVTVIGNSAFRDCAELASVTIPASVTSIEEGAFDGCTGLANVNYQGTQEQENALRANTDATGNESLLNLTWTRSGNEGNEPYLWLTEDNFPDEHLRECLIGMAEVFFTQEVIAAQQENGVYYLTHDQVMELDDLDVSGEEITSLEGLEAFENAQYITIHDVNLTAVDLSTLPTLKSCDFFGMENLTSVTLPSAVEHVLIEAPLTSLDLSGCSSLSELELYEIDFTTVDVSQNTNLTRVKVVDSEIFTTLVLGSQPKLTCIEIERTGLNSLDISGCPALTVLRVALNNLSELDVSSNLSLEVLQCSGNNLTELNVDDNTKLRELSYSCPDFSNLSVAADTLRSLVLWTDSNSPILIAKSETMVAGIAIHAGDTVCFEDTCYENNYGEAGYRNGKKLVITDTNGGTRTYYLIVVGSGDDAQYSVFDDSAIQTDGAESWANVNVPSLVCSAIGDNEAEYTISGVHLGISATEVSSAPNETVQEAIEAADTAFDVHPEITLNPDSESSVVSDISNSDQIEGKTFPVTLQLGADYADQQVSIAHYTDNGVLKDSDTLTADEYGDVQFTMSSFSIVTVTKVGTSTVSGTCGENLTWSFNPDTGILTIEGTGEMDSAPWLMEYTQQIQSVELPDGLTSICDAAFAFSGLSSVDIPNGVTTIGAEAFQGCQALTAVEVPGSVEYMGAFIFDHCQALTSVTLGEGLTYLPGGMFYGCSALETITIPNTVMELPMDENSGTGVFNDCESLRNVVLPNNLATIGGYCFAGSGLESITIPASVNRIEAYAFSNCRALSDVYYGGTLTQKAEISIARNEGDETPWGNEALMNATWHCTYESFASVEVADTEETTTVLVQNDSQTEAEATIPADAFSSQEATNKPVEVQSQAAIVVFNGEAASAIAANAGETTDIVLNLTVTEDTAANTKTLDITLEAGGENVFADGTSGTATITIPYAGADENTVVYLVTDDGNGGQVRTPVEIVSFKEGESVTFTVSHFSTYEISQGQASAPASGTCGENLTWSFDEDSGTLTISGTGAMDDYYEGEIVNLAPWDEFGNSIQSIVLEDGITHIGDQAFRNTNVSSVVIPDSVTEIGHAAFAGCRALTSAHIGSGVTTIGMDAFSGCANLSAITGMENVQSVKLGAFQGIGELETQPDGLIYVGTVLFGYRDTYPANLEVRQGTKVILDSAFIGCEDMTGLTLPEGLLNLGMSTFAYCTGLTSVTIPGSIRNVTACLGNEGLFEGCTALTSLTISDGVESIGSGAFFDCSALAEFTIPGSVSFVGVSAFEDTAFWNAQPDGLVYKDGVLLGCKNTCPQEVIVQSGTRVIAENTFTGHQELTSVELPEGITRIDMDMFHSCSNLTTVTLPASITLIEEYAFDSCSALTDVYFLGTEAQKAEIVIQNELGQNDPLLNAQWHCLGAVSGWVPVEVDDFDPAFWAWLVAQTEEGENGSEPRYAKEENGVRYINLDADRMEIDENAQLTSLRGVNKFVNLEVLTYEGHDEYRLSVVDLAGMTKLRNLYLFGNSLKTIDISTNTNLCRGQINLIGFEAAATEGRYVVDISSFLGSLSDTDKNNLELPDGAVLDQENGILTITTKPDTTLWISLLRETETDYGWLQFGLSVSILLSDFDNAENRFHSFEYKEDGWYAFDEADSWNEVKIPEGRIEDAMKSWVSLQLFAEPINADREMIEDHMADIRSISFNAPMAFTGDKKLDLSLADPSISVELYHPGASVEIEHHGELSANDDFGNIKVSAGCLTVHGNVIALDLSGTRIGQNENSVVVVYGDVRSFSWYNSTCVLDEGNWGAPYRGSLYVSGRIGVLGDNCGEEYGRRTVTLSNTYVGDNGVFEINVQERIFKKTSVSDDPVPVIVNGKFVLNADEEIKLTDELTDEDMLIKYQSGYWGEWSAFVAMKPLTENMSSSYTWIQLDPEFDETKIVPGENVSLEIAGSAEDHTIVVNGQYDQISVSGGKAILQSGSANILEVGNLVINKNASHPHIDLAINMTIVDLVIEGTNLGTQIVAGEDALIGSGRWSFYLNGMYPTAERSFGSINGSQTIMSNGSFLLMSVDGDGEYGAIAAQIDDLTAAAGITDDNSFAAMEITNDNVELDSLEQALVEAKIPDAIIVTEFEVQVNAYTLDSDGNLADVNNISDLGEAEATFYLQMPTNDPTASYEVVRIHDGAAEVMENTVFDNGQAEVTSSLFSKYVVVKINGNLVTVTFDSVGGTAVDPVQVSVGETLTAPEAPTKNGWAFAGWYTSDDDGTTLSEQPFDFTAPIADNYTLYAKWAKCSITTTLTLRDNINFNVLIYNFIESDFDNWTVEAVFDGKTKEYPLTEDMLTSNGYYKVCVATAASRQIADEITLSFWYNRVLDIDGNVVNEGTLRGVMTSSVKKFCEDRIAENSDVKLKALCEATLEYGAMAQKYFNHNTDNLANSRIAELDHGYVSPVADTVIDKTQYKLYNEGRLSCFKGFQGSLVLKSEITLKFNFKLDLSGSEEVTFYYNDAVIEPSTNGEYTVISIPGIKARELSQWYTVKLVDSTGDEMSITYSPFTFAANNQGTNTLGMLCKALYLYGLAAKSYFGG